MEQESTMEKQDNRLVASFLQSVYGAEVEDLKRQLAE